MRRSFPYNRGMGGYVVSIGGTFGVVHRRYASEDGVPCVVIRWGPLGMLTPVKEEDVKFLRSSYEKEARQEAEEWLLSNR